MTYIYANKNGKTTFDYATFQEWKENGIECYEYEKVKEHNRE